MRRGLALVASTGPLLVAGAKGAKYAARAAVARRSGRTIEPGVPVPEPSLGLIGAVAVDALLTMPMPLATSLGSPTLYARSSAELDQAVRFYGEARWLEDPALRHVKPAGAPPGTVEGEVLRFRSGWRPVEGEPAGERWRSYRENETVPVRLLRHPGAPRPWLIVVHGQGMGRASDARTLRVRRLHEQLGLNIAMPVLPLHGPRRPHRSPDAQFVSNVFLLNNVLGLTQAVSDLRELVLWLGEEEAAPAIGALGLSLGSYVVSLLATLEPDLAAIVAVVPTADLAGALRRAEPITAKRRRMHDELHDSRSDLVHSVVSPVARPCVVPSDRRFIVAGQADGIAPPADAARLWEHWDRPSILWRPRGHVTTWTSAVYDDHIAQVLRKSGLSGGDACDR